MRFKDMLNVLIILMLFLLMYFISIIVTGLKKIKQNWPKYRCNPSVMPFAGQLGYDATENFTYCIGNMQMDLMGFFLRPIYFVIQIAADLGKTLMESVQNIRDMVSWMRFSILGIIGDVLGIFMNIITRFQLLVIQMKTLVMKMIAVTVVVLYKIEGAMMTGKSVYNGPIGGVLKFLGDV
jgi:hypothetical protein